MSRQRSRAKKGPATAVREQLKEEQRRRRIRFAIAAAVLVAVAGVAAYRMFDDRSFSANVVTAHYPAAQYLAGPLTYRESPPMGGPHNVAWQNCGIYTVPLHNEHAVHALEHGAIWITYRPDLPPADVQRLQAMASDDYMVLSPYPGLPAPVVASAWRELAPSYTVREIFSSKREEVRNRAAGIITKKLATDGIIVEEVMLSDIQLPEQYAKGLEGLLLKEQQDDQMTIDTDMQQKQVRIAELQAEAEAKQKAKQAEGNAQARVIEAKGEADAMQYTLPLKQKQIEQTKLEAEARKESTIQNAQAEAEAKVIDSKAELQRRNLLADAEASRIKLIAAANAERMTSEASLLNKSPLLINKIVAERLSDKIQVVMVPSDGKFFFANDVFKNMANAPLVKQEMDSESEPEPKAGH